MCVCGEAGVCLGVLSDAGAGVCVCGEAGVYWEVSSDGIAAKSSNVCN